MPYRTPASKSSSLLVPSEAAAVPDARRRVVATVRNWCLPLTPDAVETLELLASEVIANAVVHTRNDCHVTVSWDGTRVRLEAEDAGTALDLRTASVAADEERGRGLQLVERLAKAWGSRPTSTSKAVWFEIEGRAPLSSRTTTGPPDTQLPDAGRLADLLPPDHLTSDRSTSGARSGVPRQLLRGK